MLFSCHKNKCFKIRIHWYLLIFSLAYIVWLFLRGKNNIFYIWCTPVFRHHPLRIHTLWMSPYCKLCFVDSKNKCQKL